MIVRRRTKRNLVKISTNALLLVALGLVTSCSGLFVADAENPKSIEETEIVTLSVTGMT